MSRSNRLDARRGDARGETLPPQSMSRRRSPWAETATPLTGSSAEQGSAPTSAVGGNASSGGWGTASTGGSIPAAVGAAGGGGGFALTSPRGSAATPQPEPNPCRYRTVRTPSNGASRLSTSGSGGSKYLASWRFIGSIPIRSGNHGVRTVDLRLGASPPVTRFDDGIRRVDEHAALGRAAGGVLHDAVAPRRSTTLNLTKS